MKNLILVAAVVLGSFAQADVPAAVLKAIKDAKTNDIRTVVSKAKGDNPCELDYNVDIQVKSAGYDPRSQKVTYTWETVKTISIDKNGKVMEVCAE